ncbi:conserved hypothetical protein [Pyrobaculum islandicum DSM 4184]|uniref:Uncharacterized protein n=1 Tax=Pyrobaculum islandicum (strain DSM 4184 / JCM 9189 / GEO3) TaxID=384616 RepID=A1RQM3_PYRIL|nr:hypothetical protein [Pyrobaculum islandicum]ABL87255.1 conserved hypothetical protein [Pyrobaculum islandicum DSM 4184]
MDLLRVGVALVGVALLIIALVALAFYLDVRGRMAAPQVPFSAFCYGGYVVVSAYVDLRNVTVADGSGRVLCAFDFLRAGSERVCRVGNGTVAVVEAGGYSRVVVCPGPPRPVRD